MLGQYVPQEQHPPEPLEKTIQAHEADSDQVASSKIVGVGTTSGRLEIIILGETFDEDER